MAVELDFKPTGAALPLYPAPRQRMPGQVPDTEGLGAVIHVKGEVWCAQCSAPRAQDQSAPQAVQEVPWKQYFADSEQWYDNRWSNPTSRHPEYKQSKVALWLNNGHKRAWVDSRLATVDAWMKDTPDYVSPAVQVPGTCALHEGRLDLRVCEKICEDGRISDAVHALNLLVEQRSQVPSILFYRVLRRCITQKDLVSGRRIHALAVKSGYRGDAFLATQFIGLYASHGKLDEALRVFMEVSSPDAYNWATIIFAYARHREAAGAAEAIRLYGQMRESITVKPDGRIYSAILKACTNARDLGAGKKVHAHILADPGKLDRYVQAGLVNMYAKCGSLEDARRVFDTILKKDVVTWTTMIAGYAQQGMGQEALSLYSCMQKDGFNRPDSVTYACLLQACAGMGEGALPYGKQLHAQIEERGMDDDVVLGGSLVNMYAKCGSLEDARRLFDKLPERNVVTWTAMIAGYVQQGMSQEALTMYNSMFMHGLTAPNSVTFVCLLKACASVGVAAFHDGKQLHEQIKERGLQKDIAVGGSLVNMYAKCGSLAEARQLFDDLSEKNVVTWNAMLAGYAQNDMGLEALGLYSCMQQEGLTAPDSVTFVCLLQACASVGVRALREGKQLHTQIKEGMLQHDSVLGGSLVNMYVKCGSLEDARQLFDSLPKKTVVAWTAMLAGYAQQGMGQEGLRLYGRMQEEGLTPPNAVTYVCLLQACACVGVGGLHVGKQLHQQIKERGLLEEVALGSSLVNMYAKCGSLEDARRLFDVLPERNVVTWNAMLSGYAQQELGEEALTLYSTMQEQGSTPNSVTYVCLLQACASVGVGALPIGKQLHSKIKEQGLQEEVALGGSLVNMYVKCGSLDSAREVFEGLPERNVVAWTVMLTGYAQQDMAQEAISLYSRMQQEGFTPPDSVTYVSLLQACAGAAALPLGKQLHMEIEQRGMQNDAVLGAALVNMYAKCGSMCDSQRAFDSLSELSVQAWGALSGGYARQGDSDRVFNLFDRMTLEGMQPDAIIFLSVLTVCSHAGLVDEGRKYFGAMSSHYGISANMDHFICMIDLLGRAGHLNEALRVAETMPFSPIPAVWLTLLAACQKWNNIEIGRQAFDYAVRLDRKESASYVMMYNIYARAGIWEEAKEVQARRKKSGAWKGPGQSWWTDMCGVVHTFVVGD